MKVTGSAGLGAPRDRVWQALHDPTVLVQTIPGCERLETIAPDAYRMTVTAGVGSIRGKYDGEVHLTDQSPPDSFVLKAKGAGGPGTVDASVRVSLAEDGDGRTLLTYDADALVGGMLAGVGQRMLAGVAKRTAGEFFTAVDDVLTGRAPAPVEAPPAAEVGVPSAAAVPTGVPPAAPAAGAVYTAPTRARPGISAGWVLAGAVVGALIAIAGVLIGWAIAS